MSRNHKQTEASCGRRAVTPVEKPSYICISRRNVEAIAHGADGPAEEKAHVREARASTAIAESIRILHEKPPVCS